MELNWLGAECEYPLPPETGYCEVLPTGDDPNEPNEDPSELKGELRLELIGDMVPPGE